MNPKTIYSFIIPHKNCPNLLQRCVDSIPERDDVQIIVVDDNSDADKKPSINRNGVEVVLLDAEHSKGAGRARNVGLEHAKGKWLLFADADDYYNKDFLSILDIYINSSYDVIYFNFIYKDGITGQNLKPLNFQKYFEDYDGSKDALDQIKFLHNVPWTKMVSHEYVKQNNIFFEETINGNDILFSIMAGYYTSNIAVEKAPIYVYLRNQNSILTTKENSKSALCRLIHLIKKNCFYDFIGHKEWKKNVSRRILLNIFLLGFPFVYDLIKNCINIYQSRKEWVSMFYKL